MKLEAWWKIPQLGQIKVKIRIRSSISQIWTCRIEIAAENIGINRCRPITWGHNSHRRSWERPFRRLRKSDIRHQNYHKHQEQVVQMEIDKPLAKIQVQVDPCLGELFNIQGQGAHWPSTTIPKPQKQCQRQPELSFQQPKPAVTSPKDLATQL